MTEKTTGLHRLVTIPAIYDQIQVLLGGPQARLKISERLLAAAAGKRVVEIGCGPGTWAPYLTKAASYLGIDHNPQHIAVASQRYGSGHTRFLCRDLLQVDALADAEPYDAVVAIGILHHLDDRAAQAVLSASAERLPRGGLFLGLEPVYHTWQNPLARLLKKLDSGCDIRSEQGYQDLVAAAFGVAETEIATDIMRVPYSHCLIRASKV